MRTSLIVKAKIRTKIKSALIPTAEEKEEIAVNARIVGTPMGETKLVMEIDEKLIPAARTATVEKDLDFMLAGYKKK